MKEPHLICIDLDGTLLDNTSHRPPQANLEAIAAVRRLGHRVFINTGRSWAHIPVELREVMSYFDGISCANGSYIRSESKVLRNVTLSDDLIREAMLFFLHEDHRYCLFEGEDILLKTKEFSALYWSAGTLINHPEEIHTRFNDAKFNVFSCEGTLPQSFYERFQGRIRIIQCDVFADCVPLNCSKAIGMQYAADLCGIPMERTVAIGDSANDLAMMESAAVSVAMRNSAEDIRAKADYVTDSNVNCGVATSLQKLFLS